MAGIQVSQSECLNRLLEKSRSYGPQYGNGLSNHLPMALVALHSIGASDSQLSDFFAYYVSNLEQPREERIAITRSNWRQYLGEHRYGLSYRELFQREISANGVSQALEFFLPHLVEGVSGGAFHPLIRLAYGLETGSSWEIAESLASWCLAYQCLAPIGKATRSTPSPLVSLQLLAKMAKDDPILMEGDTVFSRLKSVSDSKAFGAFSCSLSLDGPNLPEVAETAIKLYLSTDDNFTALHCVTATHALRVVSQHYTSQAAVSYLWQAVCAVYAIVKFVPVQDVHPTESLPPWEKIFEKARSQNNDHVIKLVYTASREFEHYRNPLYQLAAARKSGLVG
jgi:hypothetical protein